MESPRRPIHGCFCEDEETGAQRRVEFVTATQRPCVESVSDSLKAGSVFLPLGLAVHSRAGGLGPRTMGLSVEGSDITACLSVSVPWAPLSWCENHLGTLFLGA